MSRQGSSAYGYSAAAAAQPRHSANHGTSSAFSSSANPDEDWTQISDLAERRRIQNRIAQRNYRKKLKRRLEDLERRAGSSSASPPPAEAVPKQAAKNNANYKSQSSSQRQKLSPRQQNQYTPPMTHDDDMIFNQGFERDASHSPPLFPSYSAFPTPDDNLYSTYSTYRQPPIIHTTESQYQDYTVSAPMTLPSMMQFTDSIKREPMLDEVSLNPFSMSYAAMAGIDIQGSHNYEDSAHTPPLSHSFDHSVAGSEIGYGNYPSTPLSMPASPGMLQYL